MDTTAIRQAIRLYNNPREMSWLLQAETPLPSGMTDLLRLCASEKLLDSFIREHNIDAKILRSVLFNFIETVLLNEENSPYKTLGADEDSNVGTLRLHYQLLMRINHPDKNKSLASVGHSALISNAYNLIKKSNSDKIFLDVDDISEPKYPRSFYLATNNAKKQIAQTRNVVIAFASIAAISVVSIIYYLNLTHPSTLIVRNQAESTLAAFPEMSNKNQISPVSFADVTNGQQINKKMQLLMQDLESAYEKGNVSKIKPILANEPELREQSDKQLKNKLEALFHLTKDRKMVLYDFNWQNLAGRIQGKGKFLSRYMLIGDDEWLTRTGTANIIAEIHKNEIKIIGLDMQDHAIEQ